MPEFGISQTYYTSDGIDGLALFQLTFEEF
jgi:hypothetical protein